MTAASMSDLFGLRIVSHPLAEKVAVEWRVECVRPGARRRRWAAVRRERRQPCAFQIGSTVYMHPTLYAKLQEAAR